MTAFKDFISSFSAALIFSGIMLTLSPKSAARQVRFVASIIIIAVLSLAVSCTSEIEIPEISGRYSVSNEQIASVSARQTVEAVLRDNNVKYENLEVFTDKTDINSIFISRIILTIFESDMDVAGILKMNFPDAEVETEYG